MITSNTIYVYIYILINSYNLLIYTTVFIYITLPFVHALVYSSLLQVAVDDVMTVVNYNNLT